MAIARSSSGQCNNLYIFPAIGLAVYATGAKRVTEEMLIAAARAVAEQLTAAELDAGLIYPKQSAIRKTEMNVATRIAEVIFTRGFASVPEPKDLSAFIQSHMYTAAYRDLI